MTKRKDYLYHFKQFDLEMVLHHVGQKVEKNSLVGLVTNESILTPEEKKQSFLGIPRCSERRIAFYQEALNQLQQQYLARELPFHLTECSLCEFLAAETDESEHIVVWYSPHPGSEEQELLHQQKLQLPAHCEMRELPGNTLLQEDELPFSLDSFPKTFSQFRKRIEKRSYSSYRFADLDRHHIQGGGPGRTRLDDFIFQEQYILTYKETRNGLGPGDYASRLSRWLSCGAISAAEVGAAILEFERTVKKNSSTYWLLFELLWRDFFFYLHKAIGPLLFTPRGMKGVESPGLEDNVPWTFASSNDPMKFHRKYGPELDRIWHNFRRWALADTSEKFVDAMMAELYFTGDLSNRGRQCAASYLIHDLHVPWWWGAQWFEYLLLDYDVSSNWGNWAYIAGVGADPRPSRRFNMVKQARNYDPGGKYRAWVADQGWSIPASALPEKFPGEFT